MNIYTHDRCGSRFKRSETVDAFKYFTGKVTAITGSCYRLGAMPPCQYCRWLKHPVGTRRQEFGAVTAVAEPT
jgi:hypothetical protein